MIDEETRLQLRAVAAIVADQQGRPPAYVDELADAMASWMDTTGLDLAEASFRALYGTPDSEAEVEDWRQIVMAGPLA